MQLLVFGLCLLLSQAALAVNYSWTGSSDGSWANSANWSPAGVPGVGDQATIVNQVNNPTLGSSLSVTNLVMSSGVLNLGGNTLTVLNQGTFTAGVINNGTLAATAASNLAFTATTFGANVAMVSTIVNLNGGTFNGTTSLEQTGAITNYANGGCTFNGTTTLKNSGSGHFVLGNSTTVSNVYNGPLTATASGSGDLGLAWNGPANQLNAPATLSSLGTGRVVLNNSGNVTVNADLTLNSTGKTTQNGGIYFGLTSGGTATLALGKTLTIGTFDGGTLQLNGFVLAENVPLSLSLSSNARLNVSASTFNGPVSFVAPLLALSGSTYNRTASLEQTGTASINSSGGNVFQDATTLKVSGSGSFTLGYVTGDVFQGDLTLTTTAGLLTVGGNPTVSAGYSNQLNGNVLVNNVSGSGVYVGTTANPTTLAAGKTLGVGALGFNAGTLRLLSFTQSGSTPQQLTLTGTATLQLGPSIDFGGNVRFTAPGLLLNGGLYRGTTYLEKTGTSSNTSDGGNTFTGAATLVHSGSGGFALANSLPDVFLSDCNATATSSGTLTLASRASGNRFDGTTTLTTTTAVNLQTIQLGNSGSITFNGDVLLNCTTNGGITLPVSSTTPVTLAAGKTIGVGSLGFAAGTLFLRGLSLGSTPQALTLTGTATLNATSCTFGGSTTLVAPRLSLVGCTFQSTAYLEKSGASADTGNKNNVFQGSATLVNSGSGTWQLGDGGPDTFAAGLTASSTGSALLNLGFNSTGNVVNGTCTLSSAGTGTVLLGTTSTTTGVSSTVALNGNVVLSSTGSGITLGARSGSVTLAASYTLSIAPAGFSKGTLTLGDNFTQLGSTAQTLVLTGTGVLTVGNQSVFGGDVNFKSPRLTLSGVSCQGQATLEKTGSSADTGLNANTFTGAVTLINSGSAALAVAGGADTYSAGLTLRNSGSGGLTLGTSTGTVAVTGTTQLLNTGTGTIAVGSGTGAVTFNGNLVVGASGTGGVQLGSSGSSITLNNGTVSIDAGLGYSGSSLLLRNLTQTGSSYAQSLTLSGTALLTLTSTSFDGSVSFRAPQLSITSNVFNSSAYLEKTGATNNSCSGNTFNGAATLVNSSSANILFGNVVGSSDTFNGALTAQATGTGHLYLAWLSPSTFAGPVSLSTSSTGYLRTGSAGGNSTFLDNVTVSASGGGFIILNEGTATATLAAGKTISLGAAGFSSGELRLRNLSQPGSTAQALTLSGTALLTLAGNTFGGSVDFRAPQLTTASSIYQGAARLEKLGASDNVSTGGNAFQGSTTLVNSGSGQFTLANATADVFNADLTATTSGTNNLNLAWGSTGNLFNGLVTLNSAGSGTSQVRFGNSGSATFNGNVLVSCTSGNGVLFGNNSGTTTLAAGNTISLGAAGFSLGTLQLGNFIQQGSTAQSLTLSGTATLNVAGSSSFAGSVDFHAPQLITAGATYQGTTLLEKTGITSNYSSGGNTFNGPTTLLNSSSALFAFGNTSTLPDTFNGDLTVLSTNGSVALGWNAVGNVFNGTTTLTSSGSGSNSISVATSGTATFNGNVVVNSTSGGGVQLGNNNATSAVTLAAGSTLSVGSLGFSTGSLLLQRFSQLGSTAQSLSLSGTARLSAGPAVSFAGNLSATAPGIVCNGVSCLGQTTFTKTGSSVDSWVSGNSFAGDFTLTHNGTGTLTLNADTFGGNVTHGGSGSGALNLAWSGTTTYAGDVINNRATNWNNGGLGTTILTGSGLQTLGGSTTTSYSRLSLDKPSGTAQLGQNANVAVALSLGGGVLDLNGKTLGLTSAATTVSRTAGGILSEKTDNSSKVSWALSSTAGTYAFPFVKADGSYLPLTFRLNSGTVGTLTVSTYPTSAATLPLPSTPQAVSGVSTALGGSGAANTVKRFWQLDRSSAVAVSADLTFTYAADEQPNSPSTTLRAQRWDATSGRWQSALSGQTADVSARTVTVPGVTQFSPWMLALDPASLPVELSRFEASARGTAALLSWTTASEKNNDHFDVERSLDGQQFTRIGQVQGQGSKGSATKYSFLDDQLTTSPPHQLTYYRLRQVDFDGTTSYSPVRTVKLGNSPLYQLTISPNPATGRSTLDLSSWPARPCTVALHDVSGRQLRQLQLPGAQRHELSLQGLAPGAYLVSITPEGGVPQVIRLLVQ